MFFKLKHVKTNFCWSLGVIGSEHILRIMEEGSSCESLDTMSAIKKWSIDNVKRINEEKGTRCCKSHNSAKVNVKSFCDDDTSGEEENISKNGD